jgi:hypothetical protein
MISRSSGILVATLCCLLAVATLAVAQTPSPDRVEALRLAASRILSTYRYEVLKPAVHQSVAVYEQMKKQIDDMWEEFEQASGSDGSLAEVRGKLARAYNTLQDRIDGLEAARAREKAWDEAVRERETAVRAKRWPPAVGKAVIERKVLIGMTTDQVLMAWGRPERVNETIRASSVSEQWVYSSQRSLYFENGKLTTIQTTR